MIQEDESITMPRRCDRKSKPPWRGLLVSPSKHFVSRARVPFCYLICIENDGVMFADVHPVERVGYAEGCVILHAQ
jgi:hypothetical protein